MRKVLALLAAILAAPACAETTFPPTTSTTPVIVTGATTARPLSDILSEPVNVKNYGAKGDGSTDDTPAIQAAVNYSVTVGKAVYFPGSTAEYTACGISAAAKMAWVGDGQSRSVVKLRNGCNGPLMTNGGSHVIDDVMFYNLGFNGNRANNTDGDIIVTYGAHPTLINVSIWDVAGHAIQTNWDPAYASRTAGFEGFYQNVHIDKVNKSCWINNGPNDSRGNKITMTDCSLGADNTYYGFYLSSYGNGRWSDVHFSNRDETSTVPIAGVYIGTTGNTFTNSHFEGTYTPLIVAATANIIDGAFYASRGAYAVQLNAGYNTIRGLAGIGAASSNPNYACVKLASAGNIIDLVSSNCNNGVVDFGSDGGYNIVRVRGYQGAGSAVANAGSMAATTNVDLEVVGGASGGSLHRTPNLPADGSWSTYTPSVTYSGTAPTTATVSGRWKQIGTKTYALVVSYSVTTLGSGAGAVNFGFPNSMTLAASSPCAASNIDAGSIQNATALTTSGAIVLAPSPGLAAQRYYVQCTLEAS